MPHVSQTFTHDLTSCPKETVGGVYTYCAFYDTGANCAPTTSVTNATYGLTTHRNISAQFYKDIRDFLVATRQADVEHFPYTLEFLEDASVSYVHNQKMPPFKIGTNSYCLCVGARGKLLDYSVPFPFVYYNIGDLSGTPWLMPMALDYSAATSTSYIIERYRATYDLYDTESDSFKYTLHCFYNTDFLVLAFSTPTAPVLFSLIQQIRCWDMKNTEYYMISRMFGWNFVRYYNMGGVCIVRRAADADFYYESTKYVLNQNGMSQSYSHVSTDYEINNNEPGFWFDWRLGIDTTEFPFTITNTVQHAAGFPCIINPCLNWGTAAGKWPNLSMFDIPLEESDPVLVSKPICFFGTLRLTDQVLCASPNIINDAEYTFNNKKYYVFGDFAFKHVTFPVLFEIDDVDPGPGE